MMELYTIFPETTGLITDYKRDQVIDEYESLIWTERFIEPGDFRLIIPATRQMTSMLRPGNLLGLNSSRELMLIDNRSISEGSITATGKTVDAFFAERYTSPELILDDIGDVMRRIVENMQAKDSGAWAIPGLRTGLVAASSTQHFENLGTVNVHEKLLELGKRYQVGMAVYWVLHEDGYHELVYNTRFGEDRSDQILFSPDLDNLANVKELYSLVDSKSYVVVYPPANLSAAGELAEDMDPVSANNLPEFDNNPFNRRMLEITLEDIQEEDLDGDTEPEKQAALLDLMQKKALETLKDKKKIRIVDGEITPESQYTYYTQENPDQLNSEYRLGDTVLVSGNFTDPIQATVMEYIQSADAAGSRAYPSVVVPADPPASGGSS